MAIDYIGRQNSYGLAPSLAIQYNIENYRAIIASIEIRQLTHLTFIIVEWCM